MVVMGFAAVNPGFADAACDEKRQRRHQPKQINKMVLILHGQCLSVFHYFKKIGWEVIPSPASFTIILLLQLLVFFAQLFAFDIAAQEEEQNADTDPGLYTEQE